MYTVILAGGTGARFWPLSRKKMPKQLISVFGGKSMIQRTVERVLLLKPQGIMVVTNILQGAETARQLQYLNDGTIDIIEEPLGRNTAPAIGLAATILARQDPDAVMAVLPADHYIRDEEVFRSTLRRAADVARDGFLLTLGIRPDRPETGYGYIETGERTGGSPYYPVKRFVEKPTLEQALAFLNSGNWYWNSGMFVWQARTILAEIEKHLPHLASCLRNLTVSDPCGGDGFKRAIASMYGAVESISIDYGVMEKAERVAVIPADFGWSDVGSWRALPDVMAPDATETVAINVDEVLNIDSHKCLVYGNGKLVALVGVANLIIVNTDDALMICREERAQEVKQVVQELDRRCLMKYL